jgi:S1-C subfamily serine protease
MSAPATPPKLVRGRLKLRLALAAALVLGVGYLLAPPPTRREAPPEKVVPILEAQVEQREPARVFRGVQDVGRKALGFSVCFPDRMRPQAVRTHADFAGGSERGLPAGLGVIVSDHGDVLTHVRALAGEPMPAARLEDGSPLRGRVTAHEPESGLVLVRLDPGPIPSPPALAQAAPEPGELAVAAARFDGLEFVAPVFVAAASGDRYTLSAASGVVVPGTPVFNLAGELLAVAAGSPTASVAHAAGAALPRLIALREAGLGLPRSLGLSLQPLAGGLAERLGRTGVLVSDVAEDGPAARGGLRPGDVLEAVAGTEIGSVDQAQRAIAGAGEELALRWRRAGRVHEESVAPELVLTLAPPTPRADVGPLARAVLPHASLETAGLGPDARVVAVEGTPVRSEAEAVQVLRRRRPPRLLHVQEGTRRFYALVGGPSR